MSGRRGVELKIADLAASQWGLLTTTQARSVGATRTQLSRLTAAGVLVRIAHGVYALRASADDELRGLRGAWLALDPARPAAERLADPSVSATVSHVSAANVRGHGDLFATHHEFTVTARRQTRRPELRLHLGDLSPSDVTVHGGLPVTTPARTIVDLLADQHDGEHVAGVLADAVRDHDVDLVALAPRLAPFATRFSVPRRDGDAVLGHLLQLGGVSDHVAAEQLIGSAQRAGTSLDRYLAQLTSSVTEQQLTEHVEPHLRNAREVMRAALNPSTRALLQHVRSTEFQDQLAAHLRAIPR